MASLQDDIKTYEDLRPDLEADHLGEWALVQGGALIGVFASFDAIAADAVRRFGRGPYLIRQIGAHALNLPTSVMYGPFDEAGSMRL